MFGMRAVVSWRRWRQAFFAQDAAAQDIPRIKARILSFDGKMMT